MVILVEGWCPTPPPGLNRVNRAKNYLTNKQKVLKSFVEELGYSSCHHLTSLDASVCAKDCKKLENEKFAQKCRSNGGLFKCCIRRDYEACHECRFCCTLPMCTKPPGGMENTQFYTIPKLEAKAQENKKRANDIFFSSTPYLWDVDYRCWQPRSKRY